jgi:hypothetical protein
MDADLVGPPSKFSDIMTSLVYGGLFLRTDTLCQKEKLSSRKEFLA